MGLTTKPFTEQQRQWLDLALTEAGEDVEQGEKIAEETGRDLWGDVMPEIYASRPLPSLPALDAQAAPGQPIPKEMEPEDPPPAEPSSSEVK